ncbi:uncharacterized protein CG13380-like [Scaptodrosophila lebanonensis]|uniref:Uncharacterized protein CG13380-like n=1 Tax=Drosophila lebanonensis TaxID=7225 RepID=A0A6J2TUN7_DROLE|nr:uncharacterized protein CG13380-like [Scaptodrosophila lebanonensis]
MSKRGRPRNRLVPLPESDPEPVGLECICQRQYRSYQCTKCGKHFHGRLAEICKSHSSVSYLMDFRCCPYCAADTVFITQSDLSKEAILKRNAIN